MSLGSNIGERMNNLDSAVELLNRRDRSRVVRQSQTYETAPVGLKDQPAFLNRVVEVETEFMPAELLGLLKEVENKLGRKREIPNGPRKIDLDLLLYHNWIQHTSELSLPHPQMHERRFVLVPLLELDSDLKSPMTGRSYEEYFNRIDSREQRVEVYGGR